MNIFDQIIKEILCDALTQLENGPISRKQFRSTHKAQKEKLDFLESSQILRIDDSDPNAKKYTMTLRGLYLADCEKSKTLFSNIDNICRILRLEYENDANDEVRVPVAKIMNELQLDQNAFLRAFEYLNSYISFGRTTDLTQEDAFICPSDRLDDFEQFSEIPENMLKAQYPDSFELEDPDKKPHGNTEVNARKREAVLGASIAVLAEFPDQCRSGSGKVMGSKIAALIEEKSLVLFKQYDGTPPLSPEKIAREINKYLKFFD